MWKNVHQADTASLEPSHVVCSEHFVEEELKSYYILKQNSPNHENVHPVIMAHDIEQILQDLEGMLQIICESMLIT